MRKDTEIRTKPVKGETKFANLNEELHGLDLMNIPCLLRSRSYQGRENQFLSCGCNLQASRNPSYHGLPPHATSFYITP